jgi:hypothetical protein
MGRLLIASLTLLLSVEIQSPPSQSTTGALTGVVRDEGGGVLPGVLITIKDAAAKAVSNASGVYRLEGLRPGTHQVEARLVGFASASAEVGVAAGKETTWNALLKFRRAHSDEPVTGPDPVDSSLSAGIYQAVLRHIYRGSVPARPIIVVKSLIQPFENDLDWPPSLEGVPTSLRQQSRSADARRPLALRSESFPPGARLVERSTDVPYTEFSRVFVSADGLDALVVALLVCGNLCGEGSVLWLRRSSTTAAWVVRASGGYWIS